MSPGPAPELAWWKTDKSHGVGGTGHTVFLVLGNLNLDIRSSLTSAEWRGWSLPFDLLAMLLLVQPRMQSAYAVTRAHCWIIVLQHPWVCKVAFSPVSGHPILLHGFIIYQVQSSCQPIHCPVYTRTKGWWITASIEIEQFTHTGKQKCRSLVDLGRPLH